MGMSKNKTLNPRSGKKTKSLKNGWKILFKYLLEYKSEVILLSILGVISALANGTIPYITGRFFDAILTPETVFVGTQIEMPLWLLLIIIFGTVQLVADVVDWRNQVDRKKVGFRLFNSYLSNGWGYLLKLPKSFFASTKTGEASDRFQKSANGLESVVMNVVIDLTPQFLSIVVGFMIVFYINAVLGLILVGGVLLYSIILIRLIPLTIELARKERKEWMSSWGDNYDLLFNFSAIKNFATEDIELKNIFRKFSKATDLSINLAARQSTVSFLQRIIVTITRVSVFVMSVSLIQNGVISVGELIALNGYAMMVFLPFVSLGVNWQKIQNGLVAVEEAEKVLDTKTENYHPQDAVKLEEIKGGVEFKNVDFYYDKKDGNVLKNISLNVEAGETIALVGESGVGKSTLVELISAYYFAQKGKVLVDGVDIKQIDLTFLRQDIAVVPQEVSLFNDTIKTNIKYGNFKATDEEFEKAVKEADADRFINKFPKKYKQVVGERGVKLSVGQKQRVAIARAILRNPKILILDEPTSALDLETERIITKSLEKLMKGRTTFIVAHRLSTVRQANRIVVFKEGRIIEIGSHRELVKIKNGEYKRLYDLHIGLE